MARYGAGWALIGVITWLLWPGVVQAARLLHFEIEVDGRVVLTGMWQDSGYPAVHEVWAYFRELRLEPTDRFPGQPDAELRHVLRGDVVVRVTHGGRTLAQGRVAELLLTKQAATDAHWLLADRETERTAQAAGLPTLSAAMHGLPLPLWVLVALGCLVIVLAGLVAYFFWRRGRAAAA